MSTTAIVGHYSILRYELLDVERARGRYEFSQNQKNEGRKFLRPKMRQNSELLFECKRTVISRVFHSSHGMVVDRAVDSSDETESQSTFVTETNPTLTRGAKRANAKRRQTWP